MGMSRERRCQPRATFQGSLAHGTAGRAACSMVMLTLHPAVHAGLCQAHGIAHQRVTDKAELPRALHAAWSLNKASVVEVITNRQANVQHHRAIQAAVAAHVAKAARLLLAAQAAGTAGVDMPDCHCMARADGSSCTCRPVPTHHTWPPDLYAQHPPP